MILFFRRKPVVDNEAYGRWLRALRPPRDVVPFFLLTKDEQETLAGIGDEYVQDVAIAIGYAVHDPQVAEAGLDAAENIESEDVLLQKVIAGAVQRILGNEQPQPQPQEPAAPSFAGIGARRRQNAERRSAEQCRDVESTATFMGRPPDEVAPKDNGV